MRPESELVAAFRKPWRSAERRLTLARLIQHSRQLEAWWKCELAASFWDDAQEFDSGAYIWIEALDRADIAIAHRADNGEPNTSALCIPIELKMRSTAWRSAGKAYHERGKKGLLHDMREASTRRERRPFAVVALLLTHIGESEDVRFNDFQKEALGLGEQEKLVKVLDEKIEVPTIDHLSKQSRAHQIVWRTAR